MGKFLLDGYHVEVDLMRHLVKSGIEPKSARNIAYQFAWGRYQKEQQFKQEQYTARNAFIFIENHVGDALQALSWEDGAASGVSIFFDTVKQIFRWQFKRSV